MFTLTAHSRLPMKKIPTATSRIGFRPQISLDFPHDGVLVAFVRRYAEPIQV
jgi:hypothetical protein